MALTVQSGNVNVATLREIARSELLSYSNNKNKITEDTPAGVSQSNESAVDTAP